MSDWEEKRLLCIGSCGRLLNIGSEAANCVELLTELSSLAWGLVLLVGQCCSADHSVWTYFEQSLEVSAEIQPVV